MSNVSSSNSQGVRVPKLRFPGFEGVWESQKLSDFAVRVMRKNTNNETELPLTISSKDGLVDQITYFNKTVASKDMSGYYLLKNGEFAYNKSYSVSYDFGSVKRLDRYPMGALSTLYICFSLTKHDSDFIKVYFDSLKWYKEIYMIAAEGARNHGLLNVPTDDFFNTQHILPTDTKEQQKIAAFMLLIEKRIEKQHQLVELLKSYKRGVLSKLFPQNDETTPQYRFAGFTEPWKQQKIKELFKITRGYVLAASMTNDQQTESTPYPVYSSQTKNDGLMGYYNQYLYENAITWTTDGANAGTVNFRNGKFYCTNVCGVLLADSVVPDQMISEALNSVAKNHVSYVGNPKLMNNVMAEITIALPENEKERQVISSILSYFNKLISFHKEKLDELQSLKAGLLQQLFI